MDGAKTYKVKNDLIIKTNHGTLDHHLL